MGFWTRRLRQLRASLTRQWFGPFLLAFAILFSPAMMLGVEVYDKDDNPLPENPEPLTLERLPVLFVHGHNFDSDTDEDFNYKKNWQEPRDGLTSFKETLELLQNAGLNIEPYFIRFQDQNRSVREDAGEIGEAVERILIRHNDPDAHQVKVVVIANSKGTISTRLYLKSLIEPVDGLPAPRPDFQPVSEFVAIAPPNHGTRVLATTASAISTKEMNNGYSFFCLPISSDPHVLDFIQNLNGHDITDTMTDDTQSEDYAGEAPGSRPNGASVNEGILYVALYADGNQDLWVGGHTHSGDCQGRKLAKNLAPDAVNFEVNIPTGINVHANTAHTPQVICKALYTAVHHRVPPDGFSCSTVIQNGREVPVIPLPKAGIVLVFDTSGSMAWDHNGNIGVPVNEQRLTLAKRAATPFLDLLYDHGEDRANFGIAGFPRHPFAGCFGEALSEMTPITIDSHDTAVNETIPNVEAAGATPLLAGMETAVSMFGPEIPRAIVLLSDGYHNCPSYVEAGDEEFVDLIADLTAKSIRVYTIGFARPCDVDHHFLDELAAATLGQFRDVTSTPGFDPQTWHPATDLQGTYKAILADGLGLETLADPLGVIRGGQTETHDVRINEHDQRISFFLSWVTPDENRLGLAVRSSDGLRIPACKTPGVLRHGGDTYKIITVDSSFLKQPGKVGPEPWTIEIDGDRIDGSEQEHYQYSVIADSELKMRTALDKASYQTGEVVTLTARITEAGQPLTGLDDVKVKITRPKDGAGNWFAMHKVSAKELKQIPENLGAEHLSPAHRKAIFLSEVRKVAFPARTGPTALQLYDDGTHGDVTAGDGTYTNRFMDTSREGTYAFRYHATGPTSAGNAFDRDDMIQKYVTVKVVPESVLVNATRLPAVRGELNQFSIILTPKDALGNYLGPRYSNMIKITASQGRFVKVVQDNLDGTYSQILQLPVAADVKDVDIKVDIKGTALSFNLAEKLEIPCRGRFQVGEAVPLGRFTHSGDPG